MKKSTPFILICLALLSIVNLFALQMESTFWAVVVINLVLIVFFFRSFWYSIHGQDINSFYDQRDSLGTEGRWQR